MPAAGSSSSSQMPLTIRRSWAARAAESGGGGSRGPPRGWAKNEPKNFEAGKGGGANKIDAYPSIEFLLKANQLKPDIETLGSANRKYGRAT